jgi:hypothetical protein
MTTTSQNDPNPKHFKDKDAIGHVIEAQAAGITASSEIHGTEIPGSISAGADAARETVIAYLLLSLFISHINYSSKEMLLSLSAFGVAWLIWKTGRSGWLAWSRLERLHRIVAEERWEIEHHRQQEREELTALYAAKGFEGKLLADVIDVLMADGDRLLRVMIEEELGLSLEVHEHPLQQALGAASGVIIAAFFCILGILLFPQYYSTLGLLVFGSLTIGASAAVSAKYEKNKMVPAIVWNLGLMCVSFGSFYFLSEWIFNK